MNSPNELTLEFRPSNPHSIGVEMELQLIDATSLDLVDGILPLLKLYPDSQNVKPEFIQNTVEVASDVCYSLHELESNLDTLISNLIIQTNKLGIKLSGAGTHPFCGRLALITPLPRYLNMEREAGYLGYNQITFATHVHIGMTSGDEAIKVMRRLKPFLPVLLALSASSPYWRSHDTHYASYRHRILAAARSFGIPPTFNSWENFAEFLALARQVGAFDNVRSIHWDIRPRPRLGTLEIRVMDAQSSVSEAVALAGLVRALVFYLRQTPESESPGALPQALPWWLEKENHFQASRLGLEAKFIQDELGTIRQLKDVCYDVINLVQGQAEALEQHDCLERLHKTLEEGASYHQQRIIYQRTGSFKEIVAFLIEKLQDRARCITTSPV